MRVRKYSFFIRTFSLNISLLCNFAFIPLKVRVFSAISCGYLASFFRLIIIKIKNAKNKLKTQILTNIFTLFLHDPIVFHDVFNGVQYNRFMATNYYIIYHYNSYIYLQSNSKNKLKNYHDF